MATFVLVHGAWHDAWCWTLLTPELEDRGHKVIALDLPGDDPDATFDDYAEVVVGGLSHATGDVVLVGHSLGGLTIPLVAARCPLSRLIYLCALVPVPGVCFIDQLTSEDMVDLGYIAGLDELDSRGRRGWVDEQLARDFMYADCDPGTTKQAIARLRRQAQTPYLRPCSLTAFPETPATYVVCADDRLVKPAWAKGVARERVGANLVELPGSHSPFLSRPADLAQVLHDAALEQP